ILIENLNKQDEGGIDAHYTIGSYNTRSLYLSLHTGNEKFLSSLSLQHLKSDGYRDHSELKREIYSWTGLFKIAEDRQLKTSFFFGDLFYETPGALTKEEFDNNPLAARPGSAIFPSAENAKAAIKQKSFLAGASYKQKLFNQLEHQTVLYGVYTELKNPTIRNYGRTTEPHAGGRTLFSFKDSSSVAELAIKLGGEWQEGFPGIAIHRNLDGNPDTLQTLDEINNLQRFIFLQASALKNSWSLDAGISLNWFDVKFTRIIPTANGQEYEHSISQVAPRFALGKKFKKTFIYSSVSKGFSPPTTSEWLPTGSNINLNLKAEQGVNVDIGIRSRFGNLYADVNCFRFSLDNTIVQRRDAGGGDYFINAGKTSQAGIETMLNYNLSGPVNNFNGNIWLSHIYHRFRYRDFIQLNQNYSGNKIPGIAPHTITTGSDINFRKLYLSLSYLFSDQTPLNDNNSEIASSYHIINVKMGYKYYLKNNLKLHISGGIENLLDTDYSLGFDVNGFGGRYYNAAPGRNFYLLLALGWHK
ncbi:MAG TPA: TonB-dependent receptor, partial [Chitinophagaceae bacterium]